MVHEKFRYLGDSNIQSFRQFELNRTNSTVLSTKINHWHYSFNIWRQKKCQSHSMGQNFCFSFYPNRTILNQIELGAMNAVLIYDLSMKNASDNYLYGRFHIHLSRYSRCSNIASILPLRGFTVSQNGNSYYVIVTQASKAATQKHRKLDLHLLSIWLVVVILWINI